MDSLAAAGTLTVGMHSCACCISPGMRVSGGWCRVWVGDVRVRSRRG